MARPFHDEEDHAEALDRENVVENGRFVEAPAEREPRGEKKRKAIQLEKLGEALVKLKPGQLVRVPLPDDLRAAVVECQRIRDKRAFGGYRRQVQLIGKIMRTVDAVPIAAALDDLLREGTLASAAFQQAEQWRKRLIEDGDDAIARLVADRVTAGVDVDRTALRQLARAAVVEHDKQQRAAAGHETPSTNQKKLFRLLRGLFEPAALASGDDVEESPPGPGPAQPSSEKGSKHE
jgi:ribosome-associated protein